MEFKTNQQKMSFARKKFGELCDGTDGNRDYLTVGEADYDQNKLYEACTQCLQQWHQPTRKSTNPVNLLDKDVHIPEATTTLRQLLVKYNQQATAAAAFLLPQPAPDRFIPLSARAIIQASSPPHHCSTYARETIEKDR
ncbi:unnamed protein product [Rotaria sordida]|uniref:Uncharacterized protein n=1 Tax=Rotaria sordida TaxID=392033 RepID=A0A814Y9K3_9BILA|nr:unnamed protein product [Rotaria sordida]